MRCRSLIATWLLLAVSSVVHAQPAGEFSGNPQVELLDQDRLVRLLQQFSYTDPSGKKWVVPKGTIVDGASIPRAFWTLIGGPFDGQYRNASIIHDYYCDRKTRPWREVHRVFYDGMISRAVSEPQAKIMYYAVYKFGPRWESKVERVPGRNFDGTLVMVNKTMSVDLPTSVYDNAKVEAAEKFISEDNPSLEEIETLADSQG